MDILGGLSIRCPVEIPLNIRYPFDSYGCACGFDRILCSYENVDDNAFCSYYNMYLIIVAYFCDVFMTVLTSSIRCPLYD